MTRVFSFFSLFFPSCFYFSSLSLLFTFYSTFIACCLLLFSSFSSSSAIHPSSLLPSSSSSSSNVYFSIFPISLHCHYLLIASSSSVPFFVFFSSFFLLLSLSSFHHLPAPHLPHFSSFQSSTVHSLFFPHSAFRLQHTYASPLLFSSLASSSSSSTTHVINKFFSPFYLC